MPNLIPPVRTTADAIAYRERAMRVLPKGSTFRPLMTCYLTDDTDPDDVERGFREGVFAGVKLYPANATTNSAAGVTDYAKIGPVLARMEKIGMRFLMHGEVTDPEVDIFDREAVFVEKRLAPWLREYPGSNSSSSTCRQRSAPSSCGRTRRRSAAPSRPITSSSTAPTGSAGGSSPTCT